MKRNGNHKENHMKNMKIIMKYVHQMKRNENQKKKSYDTNEYQTKI